MGDGREVYRGADSGWKGKCAVKHTCASCPGSSGGLLLGIPGRRWKEGCVNHFDINEHIGVNHIDNINRGV